MNHNKLFMALNYTLGPIFIIASCYVPPDNIVSMVTHHVHYVTVRNRHLLLNKILKYQSYLNCCYIANCYDSLHSDNCVI